MSTSNAGDAKKEENYSVDALHDIFDRDKWEKLYAIVPRIVESDNYDSAWADMAEDTTQTAEQWKQYFEKVVRPQWEQDSPSKKAEAKNRYDAKFGGSPDHHRNQEVKEIGSPTDMGPQHKSGRRPTEEEYTDEVIPPKEAEWKHEKNHNEYLKQTEQDQYAGRSTLEAASSKAVVTNIDISTEDVLVQQFYRERPGRKLSSAYWFWTREKKYALWESQPELTYGECNNQLTTSPANQD